MLTMQQSESLDNQQRSIEERLCWLGGIIDGEGCITAGAGHTKTGHGKIYKHRRYIPLISIVNTDEKLINEAIKILDEVGIGRWVNYRTATKGHPTWKPKWEIMITGMKRCAKAANILLPYLIAKRDRLQALQTWVTRRFTLAPRAEYTEEDYQLIGLIRASSLPPRGHTSNSTTKVDEDMVHAT